MAEQNPLPTFEFFGEESLESPPPSPPPNPPLETNQETIDLLMGIHLQNELFETIRSKIFNKSDIDSETKTFLCDSLTELIVTSNSELLETVCARNPEENSAYLNDIASKLAKCTKQLPPQDPIRRELLEFVNGNQFVNGYPCIKDFFNSTLTTLSTPHPAAANPNTINVLANSPTNQNQSTI